MAESFQIVVDNETMDVGPDAILLTVGAVAVRIEDGKAHVIDSWYERIKYADNAQEGRSQSDSTLTWWKNVKKRSGMGGYAYNEAFGREGKERITLKEAMHSFSDWIKKHPYPIWGNGSDFDNAQLQHAFRSFGLEWPYRRNRCLRSLRGAVEDCVEGFSTNSAKPVAHVALWDAQHEADILASLLQHIKA